MFKKIIVAVLLLHACDQLVHPPAPLRVGRGGVASRQRLAQGQGDRRGDGGVLQGCESFRQLVGLRALDVHGHDPFSTMVPTISTATPIGTSRVGRPEPSAVSVA